MKIEGTELPLDVVDQFCALVDGVSDDSVLAFAQAQPGLLRGFRPSKVPLGTLRQRIKALIRSAGSLDPHVRELLASAGLGRELVSMLSARALETELTNWIAYLGLQDLVAALLVDSREEVRALGLRALDAPGKPQGSETDRSAPQQALASALGPLLQRIGELTGTALKDDLKASQALTERLSAELTQLTGEHNECKADVQRLETQLKALRLKEELANRRIQELDSQLAAESSNRTSLENVHRQAQADLSSLEAEFDSRLKTRLAEELSSAIRPWLAQAREVESTKAGVQASDLAGRVRALLSQQQQRDRQYGNRAFLRERHAELTRLREEVAEARRESLNPLPSLMQVSEELQQELSRIDQILGRSRAASTTPTVETLRQLIVGAHDLERLQDLRALVRDATALSLFAPAESQRLYADIERTAGALYDLHHPAEHLAEIARTGAGPLIAVRRALHHDDSFRLLIDGYNLLFRRDDLFPPKVSGSAPDDQARSSLIKALCRLCAAKSRFQIDVYFDGPRQQELAASGQVRVKYSGGEGEQRADGEILRDLEFQRRRGHARPSCVVTDDNKLRMEASGIGAMVIAVDEFSVLLGI